ncbi:hypothetical protein Kpol_1039p69 [Vanderwaltozyma polyspora DSM 70294]|uniref:PH domain-containing protein n=1 Tax=Vanderwaltozyma polyspora (strain ATCC 22028 / DSM 70294 / BCRC 21397 / CBS 2163 / NBRC 10782 / NRRL Y-8283 / UCD 57-17) TaxID=436907 RepID=A7THJ4_VANPO|nr:uncharacterized protein Kpol_1039p69 [Vanderwaltozyma polyspora DSM 70294]EDO18318.1 hypothetical protein Kpol_1039p69 [Vanderwaltozyma polyspora DSM 70294]
MSTSLMFNEPLVTTDHNHTKLLSIQSASSSAASSVDESKNNNINSSFSTITAINDDSSYVYTNPALSRLVTPEEDLGAYTPSTVNDGEVSPALHFQQTFHQPSLFASQKEFQHDPEVTDIMLYLEPKPVSCPSYRDVNPNTLVRFPIYEHLEPCLPNQLPPPYEPALDKVTVVSLKEEWSSPYERNPTPVWRNYILELNSTQLNFYYIHEELYSGISGYCNADGGAEGKGESSVTPCRDRNAGSKPWNVFGFGSSSKTGNYTYHFNKRDQDHICNEVTLHKPRYLKYEYLYKSYSLQYGVLGIPTDMPFMFSGLRLRLEGEQILINFPHIDDVIDWIMYLQIGIGISLDLYDREMPDYRVVPRRSRTESVSSTSATVNTANSSANTTDTLNNPSINSHDIPISDDSLMMSRRYSTVSSHSDMYSSLPQRSRANTITSINSTNSRSYLSNQMYDNSIPVSFVSTDSSQRRMSIDHLHTPQQQPSLKSKLKTLFKTTSNSSSEGTVPSAKPKSFRKRDTVEINVIPDTTPSDLEVNSFPQTARFRQGSDLSDTGVQIQNSPQRSLMNKVTVNSHTEIPRSHFDAPLYENLDLSLDTYSFPTYNPPAPRRNSATNSLHGPRHSIISVTSSTGSVPKDCIRKPTSTETEGTHHLQYIAENNGSFIDPVSVPVNISSTGMSRNLSLDDRSMLSGTESLSSDVVSGYRNRALSVTSALSFLDNDSCDKKWNPLIRAIPRHRYIRDTLRCVKSLTDDTKWVGKAICKVTDLQKNERNFSPIYYGDDASVQNFENAEDNHTNVTSSEKRKIKNHYLQSFVVGYSELKPYFGKKSYKKKIIA